MTGLLLGGLILGRLRLLFVTIIRSYVCSSLSPFVGTYPYCKSLLHQVPIAMPGFHVVTGACPMPNGNMELHCSINRTTMEAYESALPIGGFDFPMDEMTHRAGTTAMNYDGLLAYLQTKDYWWLARIYKNFNGQLDMHIRWSYSPRVHLYVLEFDPLHVEIGDDYELWPTPRDFYLARRAIRTTTSWTIEQYDAINEPYPAEINEAPAAIAAAAMAD